ncbi:MAG: cation transporter [Methanomassiliicoccaceae archaeon]|nr:cation transporter [Methanomassiliicoccaceae archaeon]
MRYVYRLDGLCCALCAAKMEDAIGKIDGVISARIVFMTLRLTIEADESDIGSIEPMAEKAIKKIESRVKMRKV